MLLVALMVVAGCSPSGTSDAQTATAQTATAQTATAQTTTAQTTDAKASSSASGRSLPVVVSDELVVDASDRALYGRLLTTATNKGLASQRLGLIIQEVGREFLGAEYVAGMLDEPDRELLVLSLSKFDCVLFVETVLAASQAIAEGDSTFAGFASRIQNLRYRGGTLDGYCSRLHYFSDWIADNERRGIVENVTSGIDGVATRDSPDFMSTNRSLYKRFAKDDSLFNGIREMEENLRAVAIAYVPQDHIEEAYRHMKAGDIIATATSVEGLDVSHTGFAFDNGDGTFGFMHASTSGGVKISPDLATYVAGNAKQIGIIVARPVDGRQN